MINAEKMNKVLSRLRVNLRWEELMHEYQNYRPGYCPQLFVHMTLEDVKAFGLVFKYNGTNIVSCRKELSGFVKKFPELYGDSLAEVWQRMDYTLKRLNAKHGVRYPGLNWVPEYGGTIRQNIGNPEIAFMRQHGLACWLTGEVPQE